MAQKISTKRTNESYTFRFNLPPNVVDSGVNDVLLAGTFSAWKAKSMSRVKPGFWQVTVDVPGQAKERYCLYKYYILYVPDPANSRAENAETNKWILDYAQPVMLREGGDDCNYLDLDDIGRISTSRRTGVFRFHIRTPTDTKEVSVVMQKSPDRDEDITLGKLVRTGLGDWEAILNVSVSHWPEDAPIEYWYVLDGQAKYNPDERVGGGFPKAACNIMFPHDLQPSNGGRIHDPNHIYRLEIAFDAEEKARRCTVTIEIDGLKHTHPLIKHLKRKHKWGISIRIANPKNKRIMYGFDSYNETEKRNGWIYNNRPLVQIDEVYRNYHDLGRIFNNQTTPEYWVGSSDREAYANAGRVQTLSGNDSERRYCTINWPSEKAVNIWIVGPFNNWTPDKRSRMVYKENSKTNYITLTLPVKKTHYKFYSADEPEQPWVVNPYAAVESDSIGGHGLVNYILPGDFELNTPVIETELKEVTQETSALNSCGCACHSKALTDSGFPLSPKAAEARSM